MAASRFGQSTSIAGERWALSLGVTDEVLNLAAAFYIGDGIAAGELNRRFTLPLMGEVDLSLALTITGVEFTSSPDHDGRLHASIRAAGSVDFGAGAAMPALPGRALVRADVLVSPRVELRPDGRFVAALDLEGAELLRTVIEGIEGSEVDPGTAAVMGDMLFASIGGDIFSGLAAQMGRIGIELEPHQAQPLVDLGVRAAPGDVVIDEGHMTVGLIAVDSVEGHAIAPLRPGQDVVVGLASGSLTQLALRLAEDSLGVPLPFEVDLQTHSSEVAARIRNRRLTSLGFLPDLRTGVRASVAARLLDDRIELSPREAWVELPLVPSFVNRFNQALGSLASLTPFQVSLPAKVSVPIDDSTTVAVRATELAMRPDGVVCVLEADL